ncbi:protein decapping 5 isoform X2 [Cynara cardunculus var. scolymus]|uniref:protein decapping 5 isoform X2 n=1 Tax=Cynara cardunculus var. scolymus TaxID=59895 RepID=UPI000D62B2F7|nr:protein decapping 5 isoform X2 [Cynara cardunculus var. scolymus]
MATEASRSSTSSADSYIGSLISLTSKSEIRYEGILYNINTEESSIGLTNVRSFGTEGRKRDGPQLMPSDKVYEYILFRGSDIKDLQVKSSQPAQPTQPINSDPAIIQSHYPRPATTSSSLPAAAAANSSSGPSTHNAHPGHPGSTFQGGLPLYQPGGNVGSWGPSPPPPNANSSGIAMPMYWPGYYAPPNALPQLHQQSLPRPPQGLGMPPLQQPMQYPSFNASLASGAPNASTPNLPEYPSPLLPVSTSSATLTSNSLLGSTLPSSLPSGLATGSLPTLMHNKAPNSVGPTPPSGSMQPQSTLTSPAAAVTTDVNATIPPISHKPNVLSGAKFSYQGTSQPISSVGGAPTESPTPSLVTPGQLLQSLPAAVVPAQSSQAVHSDAEVVQVSSASSSSTSSVPIPVPTEAQPPLLPLPTQTHIAPKPNGATYHTRSNYSYRGRERGRGSGGSQPVMKFTEEFDFNAMNEKFNKDEVWGSLGKSNRSGSKEKDGNATDEDELEEENDHNLPKVDAKVGVMKTVFLHHL